MSHPAYVESLVHGFHPEIDSISRRNEALIAQKKAAAIEAAQKKAAAIEAAQKKAAAIEAAKIAEKERLEEEEKKRVEQIRKTVIANRERHSETVREIKERRSRYTEKDWEWMKETARNLFISRFDYWMSGYLAPAVAFADKSSEKAVTVGISDIKDAIETSIVSLNKKQINKVSNFLSWAEKFDTGVKQKRPDLDDLPDLPNIPNIKEVVDRLFNGPGRMYTNTPSVLYYCIYHDSPLIREKFHLTRPKQQPMSTDGASEDKVYSLEGKIIEPTESCTGASCGGIFDWVTGRKGGTRRRNKKRKSRKSNKRTNRIR